jgi:SpoVK/Ycf46/Vps4 family AAA+-type ATPase
MDALLKKRDGNINQSDEDKKIVNTFLAEMSGFDTKGNVIFIGTTNNYESLDSAVVRSGRFSTKVKVDLPDQA